MHKKEASELFKLLGNEDRVKIMKMLYNMGDLSFSELLLIIGCDEKELNYCLDLLLKSNLISLNVDKYSCNKEYLNELLSFIITPCGCVKKDY